MDLLEVVEGELRAQEGQKELEQSVKGLMEQMANQGETREVEEVVVLRVPEWLDRVLEMVEQVRPILSQELR